MYCAICGEPRNEAIPKLPHTWGEWEILLEATDRSAGLRVHTCQVCGTMEQEEYDPEGTLRPRAHGDPVEELQHLLVENGFLDRHFITRDYDWNTEQAVKAAENDAGIDQDGIAWPFVINHLRHDFGRWVYTVLPSYDTAGHKERTCSKCGYVEKVDIGKQLEVGAYGDDVLRVQEKLTELGFSIGKPDGSFGRRTQDAIKVLEELLGRPVDGILRPGLWNKLFPDDDLRFERDTFEPEDTAEFFRPMAEGPIITYPGFVKATEEEEEEEQEQQDEPGLEVKIRMTTSPSVFEYYHNTEQLLYDLIVTNTGNTAFSKVALELSWTPMPENEEFSYECCVLENLAPGETVTRQAGQVGYPQVSPDQKTSTITVTAKGTAPSLKEPVTDSDEVTIPVGLNPAHATLRIDSMEPVQNGDLYSAGDEIVLQATITNDGPVPLKHVSISAGFFLFPNVDAFDLALEPGESDTRTYTVIVDDYEQTFVDRGSIHRTIFTLSADFIFDYEGKDLPNRSNDSVILPK